MSGFDPCSSTNSIQSSSSALDPVLPSTKKTDSYKLEDLNEDQICELLAHCKFPSLQDTVKEQGLSGYVLDTAVDSVDVLVDVGVKPLPARSFFKLINQWKTVGLPSNFTPTAVQSKLPDATPSRDSSKQDLTTPDDSKEDKLLLTSYAPAAVKIDQPQTNTQIAVGNVPLSDVNKDWGSYVAIAEKIRSHIKEKKFLDVTTELVRALDPLVRRVSQLLLQKFPPTTVLFYNLPISITAAKRNEGGGSTWDNVFDHWAIVNTERLFIAWRQDSAYFQVYCDGTEKDGFLATLTEGRKLIK